MVIDARKVPEGTQINCDVCVVGGGAAGITLAREFAGKSYKVCILESGGLGPIDKETDSLRDGENVGLPYFSIRELTDRGLGGNTGRWASSVRPMDEMDFEKRSWVKHSGWPFTHDELLPYYDKAGDVCGVGEADYEPQSLLKRTKGHPEFQILPLGDRLETKMWRYDIPPRHWRDAFLNDLENAPNIDTYLYANVVEIETNDVAKEVTRVKVACTTQSTFWVEAKMFVLATGGVEIPRLLLASNKVQSNGLGNQHDLVGRFFMEHPHFNRSAVYIAPGLGKHYPGLYSWQAAGIYGIRAGICPSRKLQEEEQLLNYTVRLQGRNTSQFPHMEIADTPGELVGGFFKDCKSLATNIVKNKVTNKLFKAGMNSPLVLDFLVMMEQEPNPDSRLTLTRDKDMLGLNRVKLDWRMTEMDRHTAVRMPQIISEEVSRAGLGQIKIFYTEDGPLWPEWDTDKPKSPYLVGGWHFMGTTRMDNDPSQGVVDANCKLHGISNLYVASCSVFPTVGFANPTFTLIALTLRLAEHLDAKLAAQPSASVSV
ncbi:MAG: GMC family oxidoreductase [Synechococcales bacterium]|nr:GMC family oxidoreductase [Synechococcales bacterium]